MDSSNNSSFQNEINYNYNHSPNVSSDNFSGAIAFPDSSYSSNYLLTSPYNYPLNADSSTSSIGDEICDMPTDYSMKTLMKLSKNSDPPPTERSLNDLQNDEVISCSSSTSQSKGSSDVSILNTIEGRDAIESEQELCTKNTSETLCETDISITNSNLINDYDTANNMSISSQSNPESYIILDSDSEINILHDQLINETLTYPPDTSNCLSDLQHGWLKVKNPLKEIDSPVSLDKNNHKYTSNQENNELNKSADYSQIDEAHMKQDDTKVESSSFASQNSGKKLSKYLIKKNKKIPAKINKRNCKDLFISPSTKSSFIKPQVDYFSYQSNGGICNISSCRDVTSKSSLIDNKFRETNQSNADAITRTTDNSEKKKEDLINQQRSPIPRQVPKLPKLSAVILDVELLDPNEKVVPSSIGRITALDAYGDELLDSYCAPEKNISGYRSSGLMIYAHHISARSFKSAREDLIKILEIHHFVVGYDIRSLARSLRIEIGDHRCLDLSCNSNVLIFARKHGCRKCTIREMSIRILGKDNQNGIHNSYLACLTMLDLLQIMFGSLFEKKC